MCSASVPRRWRARSTKLHEEVRRDTLGALARHYAEAGAPKGEIVVVIGPPLAEEIAFDVDAALETALAQHGGEGCREHRGRGQR